MNKKSNKNVFHYITWYDLFVRKLKKLSNVQKNIVPTSNTYYIPAAPCGEVYNVCPGICPAAMLYTLFHIQVLMVHAGKHSCLPEIYEQQITISRITIYTNYDITIS